MAKKSEAKGRAGTPLPAELGSGTATGAQGTARPTTKLKPSALLDTRGIYCGDNLEQPGRIQKEEGRMMKLMLPAILHSSFILLNSPVTASHYVKVMLDQIFGENNFQQTKQL